MYIQTEKVNIEPKSYLPVFRISQNDVGRTLKAHLVSDEGTIAIPASATVTMAGIKPSGLGYTVTGTIDGSDVTFETDATMTDEAGQIESEIRIVDGETLIGTTNVVLNIEPNPHPDDTTDGQREPLVNEITALLNQITAQADRTEEYSSKVLNMTVTAHESQEPTVTKTEGEVVNLDFGLPRGAKGERGERGEQGEAGKDGKDGIDGKDGKDGINGVTPDFSIGTVTTLEPTESASVTLTGTEEEPVLNFGIPKGAKGEQGDVSLSDLEKIMVTDTANGAIASFPDGSDLLPAKSLTATIAPKQSGSGTPSPDNIRPISGWDDVSVYVTGKNWCNPQDTIDLGGVLQTDGSVYVANQNNIYDKTAYENEKSISGQFAVTFTCKYANTSLGGSYPRVEYTDGTKTTLFSVSVHDGWATYTGVTNANKTVKRIYWYYSSNVGTYYYLQVETGTTATAYEPYTGTTTLVNLGRTVYGGTVDVVTGTMKAYPYYASYNGETLDGEWICDRAVYAQGTTPPIGSQVALISGESTTYQLTPQTINTLSGVNNVWADSGDVTIEYYADTKLYIDKKLGGN